MQTNVRSTSIEAYAEHKASGRVTSSQLAILGAMRHGRDYSLSELAQMTGVESRKRACHVTGKTVTAVKKAVQ